MNNIPEMITLGVAIIAPIICSIITTCITIRHQIKLDKLNHKRKSEKDMIDAFSSYLGNVTALMKGFNENYLVPYSTSFGNITPYLTPEMFQKAVELDRHLSLSDYRNKETYDLFIELQNDIYKHVIALIKK